MKKSVIFTKMKNAFYMFLPLSLAPMSTTESHSMQQLAVIHAQHQITITQLQNQNVRWFIYVVRFVFVLFLLSWVTEIVRISADDYSTYQHTRSNPPDGCIPLVENQTTTQLVWDTITTPFHWLYTSVFVPPIKSDCSEFVRQTNPIKLFLPRFPEALATTVAKFAMAPFEVFLDKFGNALRLFMDKFNVAERIIGVVVLLVVIVLGMVSMLFVVTRPTPSPIVYMPPHHALPAPVHRELPSPVQHALPSPRSKAIVPVTPRRT